MMDDERIKEIALACTVDADFPYATPDSIEKAIKQALNEQKAEIADDIETLGDELLLSMTEGLSAKSGLYKFAKLLRDKP